MSGQSYDDEDIFDETLRPTRTNSVQSARSELSNHEEEVTTQSESQSLLAQEPLEDSGNQQLGLIHISEDQLRKVFKRALEPVLYEVKRVKQQNDAMDKKVTQLLASNEHLQKTVKELRGELNKGVDDLSVLLTSEGIQRLKGMCLRNLDMKAKDENETQLLQKFLDKAKEEGWIMKRSGKAEKDITSKYRDNRNYLKSQIRLRVYEDLSNQTPASSSKLLKTLKFVREHLAVAELSNDMMIVIYNYAYTVLKYNNKRINEDSMSAAEKQIQKKAQKNVWEYVMERVTSDRRNKTEASGIKDRITRILEGGIKFDPYK